MTKSRNIKNKWALVLFIIILLGLTAPGIWKWLNRPIPRKQNDIPQLKFKTGDRLEGYPVSKQDGTILDCSEMTDRPALIIFGMDGCRDCIADFSSYGILYPLYQSDCFTVLFIWDDKVPQSELDKLHIPPDASFSARGMYKFTDWVPSYYLLNETGAIQAASIKLEEVIQFLPQKQVTSEQLLQLTDGKPLLVGINRCDACLKAYTTFRKAGESVCYGVQGVETVTDASLVDAFADPYYIISHAFGIDTYPTYLYVDKQGALIEDTER